MCFVYGFQPARPCQLIILLEVCETLVALYAAISKTMSVNQGRFRLLNAVYQTRTFEALSTGSVSSIYRWLLHLDVKEVPEANNESCRYCLEWSAEQDTDNQKAENWSARQPAGDFHLLIPGYIKQAAVLRTPKGTPRVYEESPSPHDQQKADKHRSAQASEIKRRASACIPQPLREFGTEKKVSKSLFNAHGFSCRDGSESCRRRVARAF